MGIFEKIKKGLLKTKESMLGKIKGVINSFTRIDEELFEQLEETMIMSDIGVETSMLICDELRKKIKEKGITDPSLIMELIQEIIADIMGDDQSLDLSTKPSVILVIGVNGVGKTTTIGKLCYQLKNEGKKVIVAAADTFRAAAVDQLEIWSQRAGVEIVKHGEGSDPASVVYDALDAAMARKCDVVVCDTAGRLHNKKNLMDELAKINRVIDKKAEGCAKEVLLVLDATTGQNAVNQAKMFKEAANITGIVLTKLDGTAKGGIVISIKHELGIPVKLIGLGEKLDDLQPFNSRDFVKALFDDDTEDKVKESDYERLDGDEDIEYADDAENDESDEIIENIYNDDSEEEQTAADSEEEQIAEIQPEAEEEKPEPEEHTEFSWNTETDDDIVWSAAESEQTENIDTEEQEESEQSEITDTEEQAESEQSEITDTEEQEESEQTEITDTEEQTESEQSEITDTEEQEESEQSETADTEEPENTKKKFSFKNLFRRKKK